MNALLALAWLLVQGPPKGSRDAQGPPEGGHYVRAGVDVVAGFRRTLVADVVSGFSRTLVAEQAKQKSVPFKTQDLGLLEAPDRHEWQKPEQIMDTLRIAEGSVVADLGAGSGWFTVHLARRVGPNGVVYAEDIQPPIIDFLGQRARRENLTWVRPILGTFTDPRLPSGAVDAVVIDDVFHELEDPVTFFRNAAKSLKPQGVIGVVDFLPGGGGPGPAADDRPDPQAVIKAAEAAGLRLQKREDIPPFLFLLVFERATRAATP